MVSQQPPAAVAFPDLHTAMRHTTRLCPYSPSLLGSVACSGVDVSPSGKHCAACSAGKRPNQQRSSCEECKSTEYFDDEAAACIKCPGGQEPSRRGDGCQCNWQG